MKRRASVKDVAAAAQVSLGTVSNVLNQPHRVSEGTRLRVEAAMRDLGFVRNDSARTLRLGRSRTLAYVMLDARNPFFTDVAHGIEEAAEDARSSLFICNSDNNPARELAYLDQLQQKRVLGVLITPVDPDDDSLDTYARLGTPLVIVDRTRNDDSLCSVAVDDVLGGHLAIEHLLDQGHRRVAFVGGPMGLGQVRDRLAGARRAWAEAGMPAEDLVPFESNSLDVEAGRTAGAWLAGIARGKRPTAAFCGNDLVALGLLQHANGNGWRIPEDLAIIGYDDIEFAAAAAVPLSSVRQPREELGRTAAAMVLEEATDPQHVHRQVVFTPTLVARASTLRPRAADRGGPATD